MFKMSRLKFLLERLVRGARRRIIARSADKHPSSSPLISGDGFRHIADHIFDNDARLDPLKIEEGDVVFVASGFIHDFFSKIHPLIPTKYILITHNGDQNITAEEISRIDEKIIHWYAQNVLALHPRVTPIPIGLENKSYANAGWPAYIRNAQKLKAPKNNRALVAFTLGTNAPARGAALEALKNNPLVDHLDGRPTQKDYLKLLAHYSFVISPPGNGEDCHRTWEALYVGTIPVVMRSACNAYFASLGLPLLVVDDWNEFNSFSENALTRKYEELMKGADTSALDMNYWTNVIKQYKETHATIS